MNAATPVVARCSFPRATYLSQPITLRAKMIVQLDYGAVLKATDDRADFEIAGKPNTFVPFIGGKNLQDITITGAGSDRRVGRQMVGTR